jgi:predicted DNA-binding transcriptional regulator AlpA
MFVDGMKRKQQPPPPNINGLIDGPEGARRLHISVRSFERLVKKKVFSKIQVGSRSVRYCPDELARYIAVQMKGGQE